MRSVTALSTAFLMIVSSMAGCLEVVEDIAEIIGCSDENAENFDPNATTGSDDLCLFLENEARFMAAMGDAMAADPSSYLLDSDSGVSGVEYSMSMSGYDPDSGMSVSMEMLSVVMVDLESQSMYNRSMISYMDMISIDSEMVWSGTDIMVTTSIGGPMASEVGESGTTSSISRDMSPDLEEAVRAASFGMTGMMGMEDLLMSGVLPGGDHDDDDEPDWENFDAYCYDLDADEIVDTGDSDNSEQQDEQTCYEMGYEWVNSQEKEDELHEEDDFEWMDQNGDGLLEMGELEAALRSEPSMPVEMVDCIIDNVGPVFPDHDDDENGMLDEDEFVDFEIYMENYFDIDEMCGFDNHLTGDMMPEGSSVSITLDEETGIQTMVMQTVDDTGDMAMTIRLHGDGSFHSYEMGMDDGESVMTMSFSYLTNEMVSIPEIDYTLDRTATPIFVEVESMMVCDDGELVPAWSVMDGWEDCGDGSDESFGDGASDHHSPYLDILVDLDEDGDLLLSWTEFESFLVNSFGDWADDAERSEAHETFNATDIDDDGYLDADELPCALPNSAFPNCDGEAEEGPDGMMDWVDVDLDGLLSFEEVFTAMTNVDESDYELASGDLLDLLEATVASEVGESEAGIDISFYWDREGDLWGTYNYDYTVDQDYTHIDFEHVGGVVMYSANSTVTYLYSDPPSGISDGDWVEFSVVFSDGDIEPYFGMSGENGMFGESCYNMGDMIDCSAGVTMGMSFSEGVSYEIEYESGFSKTSMVYEIEIIDGGIGCNYHEEYGVMCHSGGGSDSVHFTDMDGDITWEMSGDDDWLGNSNEALLIDIFDQFSACDTWNGVNGGFGVLAESHEIECFFEEAGDYLSQYFEVEHEDDSDNEPEMFFCDNGEEVPMDWVNDGWDDCGDGSDEDSWEDYDFPMVLHAHVVDQVANAPIADFELRMLDCNEGNMDAEDDMEDDSEPIWDECTVVMAFPLSGGEIDGVVVDYVDSDGDGMVSSGDISIVSGPVGEYEIQPYDTWAEEYSADSALIGQELPGFGAFLGVIGLLGAALAGRERDA